MGAGWGVAANRPTDFLSSCINNTDSHITQSVLKRLHKELSSHGRQKTGLSSTMLITSNQSELFIYLYFLSRRDISDLEDNER